MVAIKRKIIHVVFVLMCLSVMMVACGKDDSTDSTSSDEEVTRSEDWSAETHGDDADPNYDVVFNEAEVGRIDLTIASSDWAAMLTDENIVNAYGPFGHPSRFNMMAEPSENPIWVPCTFTFNGMKWTYVGVRFKGNSSLRDAWTAGIYKIPLRFDFDEFEDTYPAIDDQRFYGFKKLSLSSGYKDDSLIREKVTADIFRTLGVPAPRTAFYRLFVDYGEGSQYFGLYTMVEIPADPMLDTQFATSDGNLYKPDGTTASFGAGSPSEEDFDKETNEDEADYTDVNALYTAINDTSSNTDTWKSNVESVFDVDGFLNWLAVNTVVQNWDTYGNMTHNYYLYNDDGLLKWIPWDNNEALKDTDAGAQSPLSLDLPSESLSSWPLISQLLADSEYLSQYQWYVQKTVDDYFNTSTMQAVYAAAHALIYDYVVGADGEQEGYTLLDSDDDFIDSLNYLNSHVEKRVSAVKSYLP